jgi:hypothetical protein
MSIRDFGVFAAYNGRKPGFTPAGRAAGFDLT